MKRAISLLALAALTACGGGGDAYEPTATVVTTLSQPTSVQPGCSFSLWGDSIAYGLGPTPNGRLAEPPAAGIQRMRPKYSVLDYSENGTGAVGRLALFLSTPVQTKVVVIEYGMNDAVTVGREHYKEALRQMVQHAWASGAKVIFTGLTHPTGNFRPERDDFNQAMFEVLLQRPGVDWAYWDHVVGNNWDVIHPDQSYSTGLAEAAVHALDRVLPECAS